VLGFTSSLQGDLNVAGLPITVHAVCPDSADTQMVQERVGDEDSAMVFSAPRLLSAEEVADRTVGLLDSKELMAGRHALRATSLMRNQGNRRRARAG
jgi:short-subunit dehydrogenase